MSCFFCAKMALWRFTKPQFFNGNHIGRTRSAARQRQREDAAKLLSRAVRGVWGGPTLMKLPQDPSMYGIFPLGSMYGIFPNCMVDFCMVNVQVYIPAVPQMLLVWRIRTGSHSNGCSQLTKWKAICSKCLSYTCCFVSLRLGELPFPLNIEGL